MPSIEKHTGLRRAPAIFFSAALWMSSMALLGPPVYAFEAAAEPSMVRPGDPFIITVRSQEGPPRAVAGCAGLLFFPCGEGCSAALSAFDPDTAPGTYEISVEAGGRKGSLSVKVVDGGFKTQRLTLPEDKVTLSPEDSRRVEEEEARFDGIWNTPSAYPLWRGGFVMPLENGFSTEFGVRRIINGGPAGRHRGVDIRGAMGEPVLASNNGRVVMAEETFYGGNTVVVDHGLGVYTLYMHLSRSNVEKGEYVTKGDVIGFVGSTGRSTGPHLHFGVKINSVSVNPVSLVALPLGEEDAEGPLAAGGGQE